MLETAAVAFTTFFATISPIEAAAMFAAISAGSTAAHRRSMAIRGSLIASGIMLAFALFGELLLSTLGISLAALRTSGGILLLLIGIDMVFARSSGGTSTTDDETQEAEQKEDISVFPLATPLIAGPGAMGAAILAGRISDDKEDILVFCVTPMTISYAVDDDLFIPIIERNTTIPLCKSLVFSTTSNNQC